MITSAIKIDDEQWAEWLDAVAATPKIRHIECDAALFSFSLDFLKSLDRHSLYGAHARDILPPETARFLNESPNDQAFNNLRKSIIHSICDSTMTLDEEAVRKIKEIEKEYLTEEFIYGNNPRYTLKRKRRIEGVGTIEARMEVKNSTIRDIDLKGDFFLTGDIDTIRKALKGKRLVREDILSALPDNIGDIIMNLRKEHIAEVLLEKL